MKVSTFALFAIALFALIGLVHTEISLVTCKKSSADKASCLQCRDFYHLYEGQCYINILGCQNYVFGNICRKCAKGFILVNNQCCDKACMHRVYNEEHHQSQIALNKEEVLRKAQVDGLERSIAIIAKNSIKTNEEYEILTTKSQRYNKVFRYFVNLDIEGKIYTAISDYNIVTGESQFVTIALQGEELPDEIVLTEENIHANKIFEQGYKFIYEKYGLELYEYEFSRMSVVKFGRSTEIKCVFIGTKVLLVAVMVSETQEPYVLWKEEKTNVQEVRVYIESLKKIEQVKKEYNFREVLKFVLSEKQYNEADVEIVEITPVSQEEYIFIIYHRRYRYRFRIRGKYDTTTKSVQVKKVEEVFSDKLQDIKEPEQPEVRVITKDSLTKNVEAKEAFDYLYKIRPTFRQNLVESIKVEESDNIKKMFIITKKEGKDYRLIVLKDNESGELQLIDEGEIVVSKPTATVVQENNDGTKTVTTNKIESNIQVKVVVDTLKHNGIKISSEQIESLQYTEGLKFIEYVVVLKDSNGNPTKQVTITQDKVTKQTSIIDFTTLEAEVKYIKPVDYPTVTIPASEYYTPEIKELISKIDSQVQNFQFTNVKRIQVTSTTTSKKYTMIVESQKGKPLKVEAVQVNGESAVEVIKVQPYVLVPTSITTKTEIKTVKQVTETGVKIEYTNNKTVLTTSQNIKIAVAEIVNAQPELEGYEVVSSQTKDYVQNQQQILIMTNGQKSVQVVGHIDTKTLRYVTIETREIPVSVTYPIVTQNTIPADLYPIIIAKNEHLQQTEVVLVQQYKIFKNKVPKTTTVDIFETVQVITYSYVIGEKSFVAVVQYDKNNKDVSVIEVNPIVFTTPIKIDQVNIDGRVITTTNSIQEIVRINSNAETVVDTIVKEYPSLKGFPITDVTLVESDFSDIFEITYKGETGEITVTVRSDKDGNVVTIDDVESIEQGIEDVMQIVTVPQVTVDESHYSKPEIQKIVTVITKSQVTVDKITKVVTETASNYVTYTMEVVSNDKPYQVVVIDNGSTQEVVAVRPIEEGPTQVFVPLPYKPVVIKEVDSNGNTIIKTNDATYIESREDIQVIVKEIKNLNVDVLEWKVDSVVEVDYGTIEAVTIVLVGPKTEDAVTTTAIFEKETQSVKVISTETIQTTTTTTQKTQTYYGNVKPAVIPVTTIPQVAIPVIIKTDKVLGNVVTIVQTHDSTWTDVVPEWIEIKQISTTITKYTIVMTTEDTKKQVVVIVDSQVQEPQVVVITPVKPDVKPYYVTEIEGQNGVTIVESNQVDQITVSHPEVKDVLEYANEWLNIPTDWTEVDFVKVVPSSVSGGNTVVTINTQSETESQTIKVSFNPTDSTMNVIDFETKPFEIVFAPNDPIIKVDITQEPEVVKGYIDLIDSSEESEVSVKEVVSIEKQVNFYYEKIYVDFITKENNKKTVTIISRPDEKPVIVNIEGQTGARQTVESGQELQTIDSNGNQVVELTGENTVLSKVETKISYETVINIDSTLVTYKPISGKTIDYGTVKEVLLIFKDTKSTKKVETVVIYDKSTNKGEVITIQPVPLQYEEKEGEEVFPVGQGAGQEGVTPTVEGEASQQTEISISVRPTITVPQILIPEVVKTDKELGNVVENIQQSDPIYQTILPNSVQVETVSKTIKKYVSVIEVEGVKKQIIVLVNGETGQIKPISTTEVPKQIIQIYIKQITTPTGEVVYSSNNIAKLTTKFNDIKFVIPELQVLVPGINTEAINVAVIPRDSVNSYTIQTVKGEKKVTVEINYQVATNRTYVIDYKEEPIHVIMPVKPTFQPQVLTPTDKLTYTDILQQSGQPDLTTVLNILSSETVTHSLYKETILKVQLLNNVSYVKLIQEDGQTTPVVVEVSPAPQEPSEEESEPAGEFGGQIVSGIPGESSQPQTTTTTDSNGNTITTSTNPIEIKKNVAASTSKIEIVKQYPIYKDYPIKFVKNINFGLIDEIIMTLQNPQTGVIDTQVVSFYNKETKKTKVIAVEPITQPSIEQPVTVKPIYPSVLISDGQLESTIKTDKYLETVMTTIQSSSTKYKKSIPINVEIQPLGENVTKYVVVLEVSGKKEQKVYTVQKIIGEVTHYATTTVPTVIIPTRVVQTTVNQQTVTTSNSVEQIQVIYPQVKPVVEAITQENKDLIIDSVQVIPESNSITVTAIAKGSSTKEVIVKEYITTEKTTTKVKDQIIQIDDLIKPKPVVKVPIDATTIIKDVPVIEEQIKVALKINTISITDIKEVTVSKNTNLPVYHVLTTNQEGKPVSIEIVYNPATGEGTVTDVSIITGKPTVTTTEVKPVTGVTQTIITNTTTIKSTTQYKQITQNLVSNHPSDQLETAVPIIEKTGRYQRAMVKTIVFQTTEKIIQVTYLIDQRTKGIVELEYDILLELPAIVQTIPKGPKEVVYTASTGIDSIIKTDEVLASSITSIATVDSNLQDVVPTYIHTEGYLQSSLITVVYETARANSRILVVYNTQTGEARVMDYSKVDKNITGSKVVEKVNQYGQKVYFTDSTTTISTSADYKNIITVAEEILPVIKGKPATGIETIKKSTGTEYKIVIIDNGIVNQIILQEDRTTGKVTFIARGETSVATEVVKIAKTTQTKAQAISLTTLESQSIKDIVAEVTGENGDIFSTQPVIESGTVKETALVIVYTLKVETKKDTTTTVKITKDKKTGDVVVNDIGKGQWIPPPKPQPETVTQSDNFGNVEIITTDTQTIKKSKEINTVIETVYTQKPQLAVLKPVSVKTVKIGDIIENTVVFAGENKPTIQVVTITDSTNKITVVGSRIIPVVYEPSVTIKPIAPIRFIPLTYIDRLKEKIVELKAIIKSINTPQTEYHSVSVEDWGNSKKYTVVVQTTSGKEQNVFVVDKPTSKVEKVTTTVVSEKTIYTQTIVDKYGETVTVSNQPEQIAILVPQYPQVVTQIGNQFNVDISPIIKVIETKGKTVKEVKIMTEEKTTKTETVYTGIVNGSNIKIVDVKITPAILVKPIPYISTIPKAEAVEVTPEETAQVKEAVFITPVLKDFKDGFVQQIKSTSTQLITKYEVVIINNKGEKAFVELVEEPGKQISIINVNAPTPTVTEHVTKKTEVTIEVKTGNKVFKTTDQQVIKAEPAIKHVVQIVYSQNPDLVGSVPVDVQTTTYGTTKQTTVVFESESKTTQVTTIVDTTTNDVQIVSTQPYKPEQKPLIQVIPGSIIKIVEKKFPEIKEIITSIQNTFKETVTVESITIKELNHGKIYNPIISIPSQPEKIQYVFIYDKTTKNVKAVDKVFVPTVIKPIYFEKQTTKYNEVIIQSNDAQLVTEQNPDLPIVLAEIDTVYGQSLSEAIQTVKVVEQKTTTEYTITVVISGKSNEIVVVKEGPKINVQGISETKPVVETEAEKATQEEEAEQNIIEGTPIELGGQAGTLVSDTIENSAIQSLKEVKIISITEEDNLLNTVYTAEIQDKEGSTKIVTISVDSEGKPSIVQVKTSQGQTGQTKPVSESTFTKEINGKTGEKAVVTTGKEAVAEEAAVITPAVIRKISQIKSCTAASVKSTESAGQIQWKTAVYTCQKKTIQVTTTVNIQTGQVAIVDKKQLPAVEAGIIPKPEIKIIQIPGATVDAVIKNKPELKDVIEQVKNTYTEGTVETIEIESYGTVEKVVVVVKQTTKNVLVEFLVNPETKEVNLVQTSSVDKNLKGEFYSEKTNKHGQRVTVTNNVSELVQSIPAVQPCIKYIEDNYPVVKEKPVDVIKVVEYPQIYQVKQVVEIDTKEFVVVVEINKKTLEVTEVATYTGDDVTPTVEEEVATIKPAVIMPTEGVEVDNIVKYVQQLPDVPVKKIQTITSVKKTETIFGTEIITIEGITDQNNQIVTTVNYNPETGQIVLNDFDMVAHPSKPDETITEFSVDTTTGTKITTTNNPTVLASSQIMKTITKQVQITQTGFQTGVLIASTTTEYPDKVKVVSLFKDTTGQNAIQVISIFDKETSEVTIVESEAVPVTKAIPTVEKDIFTSEDISSIKEEYPSIVTTLPYIEEQIPELSGETPSTIIVEPTESVEFVSYIYQKETTKIQIVTMYNKTTKSVVIVEHNPISPSIKPFYYEEKTNQDGDNVIVTNNLTEVVNRIPETTVLTEYIEQETEITEESIQTVQLTVGDKYIDYTLVTKTTEGVKQYEYLLNIETKEIKQINYEVITNDIPIVKPKEPVYTIIPVESEEAQPIVTTIVDSPDSDLQNSGKVTTITKEIVSKGTKYEIEYVTKEQKTKKVVVLVGKDNKPVIIDERTINKEYKPTEPVVIKGTVDQTTKVKTIVYPSVETFQLDDSAQQIIQYLEKTVKQIEEYTIQSIRKQTYGHVDQYDILMKTDNKAPIQVTIAKDHTNNNIMTLEKKTIAETTQKSVIEGSVEDPALVEVSDIEKENIKVLSKLGLVKDIKEYSEVKLEEMGSNDQFMQAVEDVKKSYNALLNNAVIVKVLEKKSLESNSVKVFYKAKDQIYQASVELNEVTGQTKLTEFIKVGTHSYPKSEVNVYSDLCYGYQAIEDVSMDGNLDFITNHLKQKYDSLKDASLIEAQQIILENGRINYKLYYKKDSETVKYIVYYEPEYKRVLEVKGTNFNIGQKYQSIEKSKQISDPYFRKLDTYVRQNRGKLGEASVLHTESKEDGQSIEFRTVYTAAGKTYRSIASINKDTQNIKETALSEVIEIPVEETIIDGESECSKQASKLDIHALGKNAYFTQSYKFVQMKYQQELASAQLLGASEMTNYNIYTYAFYFIIEQTKMVTLTVEFNPLSQSVTVTAEPENIDLQEGYYPIRSDKRLTVVRNYLKQNNPDLANSVLVSSSAKKFYFGTLYKVVFKVTTKYIIYIAYVECGTKDVKIYDTQEVDHFSTTPEIQQGEDLTVTAGGDYATIAVSENSGQITGDSGQATVEPAVQNMNFSDVEVMGKDEAPEAILKGFARPNTSSN